MKRCRYCGSEYSDEATVCPIDGEPLETVKPSNLQDLNSSQNLSSALPKKTHWGRLAYFMSLEAYDLVIATHFAITPSTWCRVTNLDWVFAALNLLLFVSGMFAIFCRGFRWWAISAFVVIVIAILLANCRVGYPYVYNT
jgi:hypothetical protein